jgi:hypothetical protein
MVQHHKGMPIQGEENIGKMSPSLIGCHVALGTFILLVESSGISFFCYLHEIVYFDAWSW